jgi:hypothetical protein
MPCTFFFFTRIHSSLIEDNEKKDSSSAINKKRDKTT